MKLKTGDMVKIMAGRDRGKSGKITQVFPMVGRVVVEGVNIRKRHLKPQKRGEKGQVVEFSAPVSASSVMVVCSKCGAATRVLMKLITEPTGAVKKVRVCKRCKEMIS